MLCIVCFLIIEWSWCNMPNSASKRYKIELGKFDSLAKAKDNAYRTLIIGHRNPDTDSVAAAASYAELKRKQGYNNVIAGAAGIPQKRTEFLFHRFGVPLPKVYTDISPRVGDVLHAFDEPIEIGETLLKATKMLSRSRSERMPIVDKDKKYIGMISLFDLADRMFQTREEDDAEGILGRTVNTSIKLAAKALDAKILSASAEDEMCLLYLYVGAMNMYHLRTRLLEGKQHNAALIVGDRGEIHSLGIELNVKLMVITGGCAIDKEFVDEAQKKGISILQTPHDSATTVRRLKFSSPVELSIDKNAEVFSPLDKLKSIRHSVLSANHNAFAVVGNNNEFLGMIYKRDLQNDPPIKLVMVDHNEMDQAVDGADEVPVAEIVDHHRLAMNPTDVPIRVINDVIGSTCTLIAEQYRQSMLEPSKEIAGIMLGGIITDTLLLRSPTATERDGRMIEWLAGICECDPVKLEQEILNSGSPLANLSAEELVNADLKLYEEYGVRFGIGQIEESGFESLNKHIVDLQAALKKNKESKQLDFIGLMVTNVVRSTSVMLVDGNEDIICQLQFDKLSEGLFDLPGIVSRKKQLLPLILNILENV